MGQGSGKGYWDWTDPQQEGRLYTLPSYTLGFFLEYPVKKGIILTADGLYTESRAGQKLGDQDYIYTQRSLEFPIMLFKDVPLSPEKLALGLGPTLICLPFQAQRQQDNIVLNSYASQAFLVGIIAGGNYRIPFKTKNIILQFRFVHPFISPEYNWEVESSGNNRFNHLDIRIGINL